jgi:hypothetical protein
MAKKLVQHIEIITNDTIGSIEKDGATKPLPTKNTVTKKETFKKTNYNFFS